MCPQRSAPPPLSIQIVLVDMDAAPPSILGTRSEHVFVGVLSSQNFFFTLFEDFRSFVVPLCTRYLAFLMIVIMIIS